jgi:hypothetical protein
MQLLEGKFEQDHAGSSNNEATSRQLLHILANPKTS